MVKDRMAVLTALMDQGVFHYRRPPRLSSEKVTERARERLRKSFHPVDTRFIVVDGRRIGFYTFRHADDGFHLDHFYIHPDWQSHGIGS